MIGKLQDRPSFGKPTPSLPGWTSITLSCLPYLQLGHYLILLTCRSLHFLAWQFDFECVHKVHPFKGFQAFVAATFMCALLNPGCFIGHEFSLCKVVLHSLQVLAPWMVLSQPGNIFNKTKAVSVSTAVPTGDNAFQCMSVYMRQQLARSLRGDQMCCRLMCASAIRMQAHFK